MELVKIVSDTWEYKIVDINPTKALHSVEKLNIYGKEGWELILVTANNEAIFKRRL